MLLRGPGGSNRTSGLGLGSSKAEVPPTEDAEAAIPESRNIVSDGGLRAWNFGQNMTRWIQGGPKRGWNEVAIQNRNLHYTIDRWIMPWGMPVTYRVDATG